MWDANAKMGREKGGKKMVCLLTEKLHTSISENEEHYEPPLTVCPMSEMQDCQTFEVSAMVESRQSIDLECPIVQWHS